MMCHTSIQIRVLVTFMVMLPRITGGLSVAADDQAVQVAMSDRISIANGNVVVCWREGQPTDSVLVHFHGAIETVKQAYARSRFNGVIAIVNFPGLSSAYANPVAEDSRLLDRILSSAWGMTHAKQEPQWKQVTLSSFSAGYGAIREFLKDERNLDRIDTIVTADSIYAGLRESSPTRKVEPEHMAGFLKFARRAADKEKRFVLSHSAQPTTYASTTETAGYLIEALGLKRQPDTAIQRAGMRQATRASRGRFLVLGFEGTTGKDHMQHLHNIDLLWDRCFISDEASKNSKSLSSGSKN